jgi:hypothetical protein
MISSDRLRFSFAVSPGETGKKSQPGRPGSRKRLYCRALTAVRPQRELQNALAEQILEGRIPDGSTVHVGAGDGGLVIGEIVTTKAA